MKRPDIDELLATSHASKPARESAWSYRTHGKWHDTCPTAPAPLEGETLPELLLRKGAMTGPHRRARPVFLGPMRRFVRALLSAIFAHNNRSPR